MQSTNKVVIEISIYYSGETIKEFILIKPAVLRDIKTNGEILYGWNSCNEISLADAIKNIWTKDEEVAMFEHLGILTPVANSHIAYMVATYYEGSSSEDE
jgi:hypothetical protein